MEPNQAKMAHPKMEWLEAGTALIVAASETAGRVKEACRSPSRAGMASACLMASCNNIRYIMIHCTCTTYTLGTVHAVTSCNGSSAASGQLAAQRPDSAVTAGVQLLQAKHRCFGKFQECKIQYQAKMTASTCAMAARPCSQQLL